MRTDGVHCQESADTGPAALKVIPVTGATFAGHHGPNNTRLSFLTPTIATVGTCDTHINEVENEKGTISEEETKNKKKNKKNKKKEGKRGKRTRKKQKK